MKRRKIQRSLSLCIVVLMTLLFLSGPVCPSVGAETIYRTGDHIQFGTYPQSRVTDEALIAALNGAEKTWKSYGYYGGTGEADGQMQPTDHMRFADFFYNGEKYRSVVFDTYRPKTAQDVWRTADSYQNYFWEDPYQKENGYESNTIYYFKYEPLHWRILDPSTGLILCEDIIDSQPLQNVLYCDDGGWYYWQEVTKEHIANDYASSSLNAWLNRDFCETAFTEEQMNNIKKPDPPLDNGGSDDSGYHYAETDEKMFLLTFADVVNTAYGFGDFEYRDPAKYAWGTEYAKCQGLQTSEDYDHNNSRDSDWWLRLPDDFYPFYGSVCCSSEGFAMYLLHVGRTANGVRPACHLAVLRPDATLSESLFSAVAGEENTADATPTDATPTDATPTDAGYAAGDVDGNGKIESADARLALRASVKLENYQTGSAPFVAADVDVNGRIESSDARTILRVSVKLESL